MSTAGTGHKPENLAGGAVLTTLSFFCVALVGALGKAAGQLTSTAVVVLFQNLICFVVIIPLAIRGGPRSLRTDKIGLHVLRASTGTACWYALFVAITMMPLTNAVLLTFSAPLWMPGIAWLVSRQKASMATWAGAAIGFVGVILVLQPQHHHFNIGTPLALAGALLLAVALMSVRWLGATEPMPRILFYYFLFSTVMVLPLALVEWRPLEPRTWIYLSGVGVAQLLFAGVHRARVSLRVIGQARSVYLYNDCLHSVDRLGHLASAADVVRRPRHSVGHRWWARRDSRQNRRSAGGD
jgi:drug/metabolite transporter (DMT)-like permease